MADMKPPLNASSCLLLADGSAFWGKSVGATQTAIGEICFNTGMTGYQEVLTDPSYAGQIVTFTFPHIGNVGCNPEDLESHPRSSSVSGSASDSRSSNEAVVHQRRGAVGVVLREDITAPSNFRSVLSFSDWLKAEGIAGIAGVDTRKLTRHIRKAGAQNAMIVDRDSWMVNREKLVAKLQAHPSMAGMELAKTVTAIKPYEWQEREWQLGEKKKPASANHHVVAIDFGEKLNILRCLVERGCKVSVVPAQASAEEIMKLKPDGIFISNGPGDPSATVQYAGQTLKPLIDSGLPVFGICLGHQLLGLALGAKTEKMHQGHRGANHPVKNLDTGAVEITSQNHGFCVSKESLPADVEATHVSLFDGCLEGLRHKSKPVFSVQYHPEASPGPNDSKYLFDKFVGMMDAKTH